MPLTPKGYCDEDGLRLIVEKFPVAEMPLTPKGYCDHSSAVRGFSRNAPVAEMPLTPKGYCDTFLSC